MYSSVDIKKNRSATHLLDCVLWILCYETKQEQLTMHQAVEKQDRTLDRSDIAANVP